MLSQYDSLNILENSNKLRATLVIGNDVFDIKYNDYLILKCT